MLLEFAIQNFKSFKDLQVFSMEASKEKEDDENVVRVVKTIGNYNVLKTKAIYGANGSGKSNLILGLIAMWQIMEYNLKGEDLFLKFILPYKLDAELINQPSYFQIIFTHQGDKYRYGFEVDQKKIHSEWLYLKREKEVVLFEREDQKIIELNETTFKEGKIIKQGVKMFTEKTLIVSILDQFSEPISSIVKGSINKKIRIGTGFPNPIRFLPVQNKMLTETIEHFEKDKQFQIWTKELLREIDHSIESVELKDVIFANNGKIEKIPQIKRLTNNGIVDFWLEVEEAAGTKKLFNLSYIIYSCIKEGKTFIIDEMDSLLHPKLTRKIIQLFQSPEAHPEAQLIFATHDTNLMDSELLRRDQITFVEKSDEGYSEIYDLSDINGVRANDLFEKNYLKGNYGALPILNNY